VDCQALLKPADAPDDSARSLVIIAEKSGTLRRMKATSQFLYQTNVPAETANVLILPVPYERTVSYMPGTRLGPEAMLAASEQLELYEEDVGWCPTAHLSLCVLPPADASLAPEEAFHDQLFERVKGLPQDNLFIGLGGEHSITPSMVFARMPTGGTVVQIDAHADLRRIYHGSIYNHACPMYRLREKGYELIQIGIRSLTTKEAALIADDVGITTYFDRPLQRSDAMQAMLHHLTTLSGPVWLTIDMDGFDPALIAGVGTPQPGGLSWHQGLDILETLIGNPAIDLRGVDILELVPEASRVTDMMGAKLIQKCLSYWGKAKGFEQRSSGGSRTGVGDE
jgi:agmatinase